MKSIFVLGELHLRVKCLTTKITLLRYVVIFLMIVVFVLLQRNLCLTLVPTYGTIIYLLLFFLGLIMVVIDVSVQWALWLVDLLLIHWAVLALGLDIVSLYVVVLVMHGQANVRYRSVHTTWFRAFNWLVVILLSQISWHVIFSCFIMRLVIDSSLVKMLSQGFLLVIHFAAPFHWTWEVLASLLGIGFKFFWFLLKCFIHINYVKDWCGWLFWPLRS